MTSKWIKLADKMPVNGIDVLCADDYGNIDITNKIKRSKIYSRECDGDIFCAYPRTGYGMPFEITHWMPLPEKP